MVEIHETLGEHVLEPVPVAVEAHLPNESGTRVEVPKTRLWRSVARERPNMVVGRGSRVYGAVIRGFR